MAETITHAFVSAKSDSPDTTLVSATEWNDGHVFSGGINGQHIIYDNTQPNNIRWTDGVAFVINSETVANPTASPIANAISINVTVNSPAVCIFNGFIALVTTGAVTWTYSIFLDDVLLVTGGPIASNVHDRPDLINSLTAGTHTFRMSATSTGGVNFTGGTLSIRLLTAGQ